MQYKTTTGWLVALVLYYLPASALRAPLSDDSSIKQPDNELTPPHLEEHDLITHEPIGNTRVQLLNNTCTPYNPNTSAILSFRDGWNIHGFLLNVQFDIFDDAKCSKPSLLETLWQEGTHQRKRLNTMYDLHDRLLRMQSVRARYGRPDEKLGVPAAVAGWNNTAIFCEEETYLCHRRDGTTDGSTFKREQEVSYGGIMGQFTNDDCSAINDDYFDDSPHLVNGRVIFSCPTIDRGGDCKAWYPVLDQQHGLSIGIHFGEGAKHIQHVDFFKSNPACEADEEKSFPDGDVASSSCCDKSFGGFLGTINSHGIDSDFGATKNLGLGGIGGICAQIGVDQNQTLWETRYFSGTIGA